MLELRWAPLARRDLARLNLYYRKISPDVAKDVGARILEAGRFLQGFPEAGPISIRGDRRKWRARKTPYLLFHRVLPGHVVSLRVLHERQDPLRH